MQSRWKIQTEGAGAEPGVRCKQWFKEGCGGCVRFKEGWEVGRLEPGYGGFGVVWCRAGGSSS